MSKNSSGVDFVEEHILPDHVQLSSQCYESVVSSKSEIEGNEMNSVKKIKRLKSCLICGVMKNVFSLHKFPSANNVRAQWAAFCGIDVENVKDWQGICDNHFVEDDFMEPQFFHNNKRLLKRNRIPTQNPPKNLEELLTEELTYETIEMDSIQDTVIHEDDKTADCDVKNIIIDDSDFDDEISGGDVNDNTQSTIVVTPSTEIQKRTPLVCKRKFPRYFMDIKSQDVCSPKYAKLCLEMGQRTILDYRKKITSLQHQNKKLQKKLLSAEEVFRQLKNNTITMSEALWTIESRHIFKFADKACFI